ncbi:MAG: sigma-70 family RNA polymerase sigma factor [Phycisphaeraceae bacterium]|nr:sigma-70 family RNA polymerase sigma factor [Phycisphaeraceae bacterium]
MSDVPRLTLQHEDGPVRIDHALPAGEACEVGRAPSCALRLDHESISRSHARLAVVDGQWTVADLGSRHGTYVNQERLAPEHPRRLASGDLLVVGPWRWRVELEGSGRADERIAMRRVVRSGAETYATRPTIFLRLQSTSAEQREVSWQEFHDRYAPVIRGFVRNAGGRGDDAEDVVQDVLLGFFQAAPRFTYDPERGRFRGYLKRCTLNAMRRRRHGQVTAGASSVPLDEIDPALDEESEAPWENAWAEHLFERAVREIAARVDAKTFEAFELYGRRGMPAEQVAEQLGLAVNSVHQAKTRVTKMVRDAVDALRAAEG